MVPIAQTIGDISTAKGKLMEVFLKQKNYEINSVIVAFLS